MPVRLAALLRNLPPLLKLVYRLLRDPRTSKADKAILAGMVLYVLNPFDLLPDALPVIGQIDDLYLLALGILRLLNRTDPAILESHWQGEGEVRPLVEEIVQLASFYLPRRVQTVLLGKVNRQGEGTPS